MTLDVTRRGKHASTSMLPSFLRRTRLMASLGPIGTAVQARLQETLRPTFIQLVDNSHEHAAHKAMRERPGGAVESHFTLTIVSDCFEGKPLLARHRLVNDTIADFMNGKTAEIHAFSMQTKTPTEWEKLRPTPTPAS